MKCRDLLDFLDFLENSKHKMSVVCLTKLKMLNRPNQYIN